MWTLTEADLDLGDRWDLSHVGGAPIQDERKSTTEEKENTNIASASCAQEVGERSVDEDVMNQREKEKKFGGNSDEMDIIAGETTVRQELPDQTSFVDMKEVPEGIAGSSNGDSRQATKTDTDRNKEEPPETVAGGETATTEASQDLPSFQELEVIREGVERSPYVDLIQAMETGTGRSLEEGAVFVEAKIEATQKFKDQQSSMDLDKAPEGVEGFPDVDWRQESETHAGKTKEPEDVAGAGTDGTQEVQDESSLAEMEVVQGEIDTDTPSITALSVRSEPHIHPCDV